MQAIDDRSSVQQRSPRPAPSLPLQAVRASDRGGAALLEPLELEALMLNMDASLRVYTRHQLFGWTQGMLQNLVRHDLLVCTLSGAEPSSGQLDCFAGPQFDQALIADLYRRDTQLVPHLAKSWEEGQFNPVLCSAAPGSPFAAGALAAELKRTGAHSLMAHGTYDAFGKPVSLFVLAGAPADVGPRQALLVELIVPFLHLACVRTRINRPLEGSADAAERSARVLTAREEEILHWIHIGKSNIEIGAILEISPLTVKNHVQKILRKLNVQNRTQAVGKALALRILNF